MANTGAHPTRTVAPTAARAAEPGSLEIAATELHRLELALLVELRLLAGHGFKLAPTFGDVAADFVIAARTERSMEHLAPERYVRG